MRQEIFVGVRKLKIILHYNIYNLKFIRRQGIEKEAGKCNSIELCTVWS